MRTRHYKSVQLSLFSMHMALIVNNYDNGLWTCTQINSKATANASESFFTKGKPGFSKLLLPGEKASMGKFNF